ncbi:MAG: regulatory protein RecX [Pseudomonadota bacterium]
MPPRAPKPISEASLHQAALRYLERFAASAEMVRRVLARRVERAVRAELLERTDGARLVEQVVARLVAAGLIDDGVFAEARSRSLRRRGASERAIRARLGAQGLSGERIGTALAALRDDSPDPEFAAALQLARRRRLGPFRAGDRTAYRLRDLNVMARAGFSGEIARRVIDAATPTAPPPSSPTGSSVEALVGPGNTRPRRTMSQE